MKRFITAGIAAVCTSLGTLSYGQELDDGNGDAAVAASAPGGPSGGSTPYIPLVDWESRLNVEERLQSLGDDLMGDQIDPHTGALTFLQTDISLPGDFDLPVGLQRQLRQGKEYGRDAVEFGDWELTVPRLSVVTAVMEPWSGNRCSDSFATQFGFVSFHGQALARHEYSNGIQVETGGSSTQLLESPNNAPWPSAATHVTESNWYFECDTSGQTFIGHAPDGSTYTFDRHIVREAMPLETTGTPQPLERETHILAATQVTDRHGNWVRYTYDSSDRLTRIHASDGREITLGYSGASKLIASATANGRTWTYSYRAGTVSDGGYVTGAWGGGGTVLASVDLPDSRSWTFTLDAMQTSTPPMWICPGGGGVMQITHPSGVQGEFVTQSLRHRFAYNVVQETPTICPEYDLTSGTGTTPGSWPYAPAATTQVISVARKTLTAPDAPTAEWLYEYEQDTSTGTSSSDRTNWTKIAGPQNHVTVYHAWNNEPQGGALVREEIREIAGGPVLESREIDYVTEGRFGSAAHFATASAINGHSDVRRTIRTTTQRDGTTYTSESDYIIDDTDPLYSWGNPVELRSVSNLAGATTRTVELDYSHDTTDWVLGLVTQVTRNGKVFEDISYNAANLPTTIQNFGVTVETRSYNADGTMAWVRDALNRQTTFANYKRGYPQTITRADGTQIILTVDDNGWITSITDARGTTTGYSYGATGWLELIDRPAGFADTTISYSSLGLGVVSTSETGALRTITEHDRFHRPLRVEQRAILNGGGSIFTRFEYDALGRTTFESFPAVVSNPTTGSTTTYDALGRVTRTEENVAPFAATLTDYLTDNRVRVTDPMGHVTTTWRSGYGGPDDGETLRIDHPLGLTTAMTHDAWGNMLTARQWGSHSGFAVDETQSWTYDASLRVCRHVTPETRATQYTYDAAGQRLTVARGMGPTAACGTAGPSSTTVHAYDLLGQLISVDYPGTAPDATLSYDANGNLLTANRGISAWTYTYDVMDRLTEERLVVDGRTYETDYAYESDGRFRSIRTAGGRLVFALPDGHGRPRGARWNMVNYAGGATYHPSGQLATASLGNGLTYSATFNSRHQMMDLIVAGGGTNAVDFSYNYDANGRVTDITDHATPGQNRSYTYDALGRLSTASGPWGAGRYTYDLLNNIRSKTLGLDTVEIEYNANNQIHRARDTRDGNVWRLYGHDARGNVLDNSNLQFTYDRSDQPVAMSGAVSASFAYDAHNRRVKQIIDGETIYTVYGSDGTILYRDNVTTGETTDYLRMGRAGRTIARIVDDGLTETITYSHQDHLGSSASATDAAGNLLWREDYTPFGETRQNPLANANEESFTGHIRDTATGLTYMQARYYDPVIGRFLSNDPVGFAQGGWQYFNRYSYTANDPVNHFDPDGMQAIPGWAIQQQLERDRAMQSGDPGEFNRVVNRQARDNAMVAGTIALLAIPGPDDVVIAAAVVTKLGQMAARGATRALRGTGASGTGGRCCFVAGTLVETEVGLVPIETVAIGDYVWARNPESGATELKPVTHLFVHERVIWEVELTGENGAAEFFETTDDHPWWIVAADGLGSWVLTRDLTEGMTVVSRTEDGSDRLMTITAVSSTSREDITYNFTVADFHTYFVGENRVLVHNCGERPVNIYEVDGAGTPSGKPYIGSGLSEGRRMQETRDGRNRPEHGSVIRTVPESQRRQAEQEELDRAGGVENTDNRINVIRKKE